MQLVLLKYVQVFCMTLFISNNVNCDQLLMQKANNDNQQLYENGACLGRCIVANRTVSLSQCYTQCAGRSNAKGLKKIYENLDINLICRDDTKIVLQIIDIYSESGHSQPHDSAKNPIYIVKVHESNPKSTPIKQQIYFTNSSLIEINQLYQNTSYNISAAIVYGNNEYSQIASNLKFSTLNEHFMPQNITEISLVKYEASDYDPNLLNAIITWKPGTDMTCYYDILCYSPESTDLDLLQKEAQAFDSFYTATIENLFFGIEYQISIRSKNLKNTEKESYLYWYNMTTPTCHEWNQNHSICPPVRPNGLNIVENRIEMNKFSINISWDSPEYLPNFYRVKIVDIDPLLNSVPDSLVYFVAKDQTWIYLPNIIINGTQFDVELTAYSAGYNLSTSILYPISPIVEKYDNQYAFKILIIIVVIILIISVSSLFIIFVCHRREKLKRYEKRCKYFEELESQAPIDPKSGFEFSTKGLVDLPSIKNINNLQKDLENILCINDEMELDRKSVVLLEVIGEGAFGLVRKGILKTLHTDDRKVAVKMLKDNPSANDIKEFRREIDVMKSVGKHTNIVSIVGHCTKNINEMLLLIEYCNMGNLLDFLRSEWNFINKVELQYSPISNHVNIESLTPVLAAQKQPEDVFNFNSSLVEKIPIKYKNIISTKFTEIRSESGNYTESLQKSSLVVNNGYDINSTCTSSCKCKVNILSVDVNSELFENVIDKEESVDDCYKQKLKIDYCDCRPTDANKNINGIENKCYYEFSSNNDFKSNSTIIDEVFQNEPKREMLTGKDLLQIAKQIATGMEFLSINKVVHRDLAARNVLICEDRTVKIADFGLSRDIYQDNIYKKTGNGKLPIKWLALESMTHQIYTSQSDVWSFGILLYEIVTLGGTPYPSISTSRLLDRLKTGYRMEKPKNCSQLLYNLMYSCWDAVPSNRPNFSDIRQNLNILLMNIDNDEIINIKLTENNKRIKSSSSDSYLKPI